MKNLVASYTTRCFGAARSIVLPIIAALICPGAIVAAPPAQCDSTPVTQCRAGGSLLYSQTTGLHPTWIYTAQCHPGPGITLLHGNPNVSPSHLDKICRQISQCPAAGAFGKFLASVTGDCTQKHFDGYFGLDGLTFGILDFTADKLPNMIRSYQSRYPAAFQSHLQSLALPMQNGCWSKDDVCDRNKHGAFICRADFHAAFASTVTSAEFQKTELQTALDAYESRIAGLARLGLQTEYGIVAMATVENGLKGGAACQLETWKRACGVMPEAKLVHCMLDQYAVHECRGGQPGAAAERRDAINRQFVGAASGAIIHPTADQVTSCSTAWGGDR